MFLQLGFAAASLCKWLCFLEDGCGESSRTEHPTSVGRERRVARLLGKMNGARLWL